MKLLVNLVVLMGIQIAVAADNTLLAKEADVVAALTHAENELAKAVVARDYDSLRRIKANTYV